jgi:uracil-DNA glycosylase
VIIGQDPYHGEGQAHGLCFSVRPEVDIPPSLVNIYKELQDDMGCYVPNNGYLVKWAKQGVLLLNNVLTVRSGQANSHKDKGWENFTDDVIKILNKREKPIVFMFWGACAKTKEALITNPNHLVLKAVHPSPLSAYRGFFGCKHFSKANEFLKKNGEEPVDWQIENI